MTYTKPWLALAAMSAACSAMSADQPPIVHYDVSALMQFDDDPAQRRLQYDTLHLVASLQGLVNRDAPRLFLRAIPSADDFWWARMHTDEGAWLAGREVLTIPTLDALLLHFARDYKGVVVWDERVPATSNIASSVAGVERLLCLRHDPAPGSLYHRLVLSGPKLPVGLRLLGDDGGPLFTGTGMIPQTQLPSTSSAKCDAYQWLIERYLKTGRSNPSPMGYYIDAYWLRGGRSDHGLLNHDFIIARGGVVFDLHVWEDEAPVDDPEQPHGTDVATLKDLLLAAHRQADDGAFLHVAGFVPWLYKYTSHGNAGGGHDAVPTEWRYAEILSCYNAYLDADAIGYTDMANASFFQHFPLEAHYPQNPKPTLATLQARGLVDNQGRVTPGRYCGHYVGDYDAAAWLYRRMPDIWTDERRGETPLSWAFNPNLCERFPLGMAWTRQTRTANDSFVAGDSGAGYINPGHLTPPRRFSGLPSGVAAWEAHCRRYYKQWDISLTGFVIDGYAPAMNEEVLDAYARFSPGGIVAQKVPPRGLHNGVPVLRMATDLTGTSEEAADTILHLSREQSLPSFLVVRSILRAPSWYAEVDEELARRAGDEEKEIIVVDMHTLLELVRIHESGAPSGK